jgi:pimeloyl-ACP methyl ester carboxylesterase
MDLDLMREAVGDEKLHYYGVSYGTLLGSMYANMYPENVLPEHGVGCRLHNSFRV